ncbi:hypothetical protein DIS24_g9300 [Lasiodiplodia hormozganensis]|uniref:Rrn9 domain-containing protein n=1 Tax=Lasiodiplodia hormozganensis TaxID=869390 RepID=A0AA39XUI0_9PEZI|nr:hypothetical protein DIS24_g9300 [Lasiodiplodia hormozganensis]
MSLFGGPLPANARESSPYYRSSSLPLPSSPPPVPHTDDDAPVSSIERDPDQDDEAVNAANDDDSSGSEYTTSDSEDNRPRFQGKWQTYRRHIQEERDLTESLAKLRAEDLALHLYDAHALKRRLLAEKAARRAAGEEAGDADDESEDDDGQWKPPRAWTAWPLEPEHVPRPYERFTILPTIDPDEEFTFRRPGHDRQRPIRDIKEILVGLVQKNAKERWNKKEWAEDTDPEAGEERSTSRRSSHGANGGATADRMDTDGHGPNRGASARRAATPTGSRREFILDDDRAYEALGPTTRSIVSKLNDVLMAVHQRESRGRGRKSQRDTATATDTEASRSRSTKRRKKDQNASEGETKAKRPRGRPPKSASQTPGPDSTPYVTEGEETSASAKKRGRGRPKKYDRLPGESYYMARKRLAAAGQLPGSNPSSRAQTTEPEPDRASSRPPTPNNPSAATAALLARPRSNSTSSEDDSDGAETGGKQPLRRGGKARPLKDWRDVLSKASSLGGFSEAAIARATRRCAELFGEDRTVRTAESQATVEAPAEEVQPGQGVAEEKSAAEEDAGEGPSAQRPPRVKAPQVEEESSEEEANPPGDTDWADDEEDGDGNNRPAWDGSSLACPHSDCERHTKPYAKLWRLREHVKRTHKYTLDAPRINSKEWKKWIKEKEKGKSAKPKRKGKEKAK